MAKKTIGFTEYETKVVDCRACKHCVITEESGGKDLVYLCEHKRISMGYKPYYKGTKAIVRADGDLLCDYVPVREINKIPTQGKLI